MLYFILLFISICTVDASCNVRNFGQYKIVCVCNETSCDELELLNNVSNTDAALYTTNKVGARFQSTTVPFSSSVDPGIPIVEVNNTKIFQFILGFGGAFTDAAGINIKALPSKLQERLLMSYFSEKGLSYNMGRIPMASCDFSTHQYSYNDVPGDFELKHFQLTKEDFSLKTLKSIPISTSECERVFSCMNNIMTNGRNSTGSLIFISRVGPPLKEFCPEPYVKSWLQSGRRLADETSCPIKEHRKHPSLSFFMETSGIDVTIPLIQKAASIGKSSLLLFGSPWSAPAWMKTNNAMNGKGNLKGNPGGKYYQTWADYFVRFLQEYKKNNITLWGITTQNEPTDGCIEDFPFQSICFPPEKQRDFLKLHLGPSLQKAGFGVDKLKLMILDDDRVLLPKWAEVIMKDDEAAQFVSGIAFHWYNPLISPYKLLDITHRKFPNLFFLASEACTGSYPWDFPKVDLGSWIRAEKYASDIIQDLLNWSIGWIDWNLALDMEGGPNWVKNFVDSPIIINNKAKEFYKQPMYYAIAQFSKCLPRGSYRIDLQVPDSLRKFQNFYISAFQTPQDEIVVIAVNRNEMDIYLALHDAKKGYLNVIIGAHSIQSYVWTL